MARSSMTATARWAGTVPAGVVLAIAAGLGAGATHGAAPGDAVGAVSSAAASCQQDKRSAVTQALAVSRIRAEIVIIVDISQSMNAQNNNLYRTVRKLVPALMATLAKRDSQDLVGVITMGARQDTQVVVTPGQPSRHTWVPPTAPNSEWTDLGLAFHEAVGLFSDPPSGGAALADDVLLLSDGKLSDTTGDDHMYGGRAPAVFKTRAWTDLRKEAHSLGVTGYELPLTSDKELQASQERALEDVFPHVTQLQYSSGLATGPARTIQEIQTATTEQVQNTKIANAVSSDNGAGVKVTWSGLPGRRSKPINLGTPGHADATVTVHAGTQLVPLCLSRISLTSVGLRVAMRGVPTSAELGPGASATWHVRLTWSRKSSLMSLDPDTMTGHLVLGAAISSPYQSVISPVDPGFSYGHVLGGASPVFTATVPVLVTIAGLIAFGAALVTVLAVLALWRSWLDGELILATGKAPPRAVGEERVRPAKNTSGRNSFGLGGPRRSHQLDDFLGKPAWLFVRGSPRLHRPMKVRLKIQVREQEWTDESVWLSRGEKKENLAGVAVQHKRETSGKRFRWRRRKGPDVR